MSIEGLSVRKFVELVREDYRNHDGDLTQPGLWALLLHRVGDWGIGRKPGRVRELARAVHMGVSIGAGGFLGIRLHPLTSIGRRVRIWHHSCIRIEARSVGDDVQLRQNTIVGPSDPSHRDPALWPVLGERVDVGSGAVVHGPVTIGADALVGANSYVSISAPPSTTVVGVPARVLPKSGKPRLIIAHNEEGQGAVDQNPKDISLGALLSEDYRVHGSTIAAPGFWAVAVHRLGNWRMGVRSKALRAPLSIAYKAAFHGVRQLCGIDLPYDIQLGRRVRIVHHGSIHIGARSIGDDVVIRHAASVGVVRAGQNEPKPIIGNRVEIGPRACIVGSVTIGDDSIVGPNTVVPINLPPGTFALGVPARFVNLARVTGATKTIPPPALDVGSPSRPPPPLSVRDEG